MNIHGQWSTENEIEFIERLGTHSRSGASRRQLLEGYLRATCYEKDWGNVNRRTCVRLAKTMLGKLKG